MCVIRFAAVLLLADEDDLPLSVLAMAQAAPAVLEEPLAELLSSMRMHEDAHRDDALDMAATEPAPAAARSRSGRPGSGPKPLRMAALLEVAGAVAAGSASAWGR